MDSINGVLIENRVFRENQQNTINLKPQPDKIFKICFNNIMVSVIIKMIIVNIYKYIYTCIYICLR